MFIKHVVISLLGNKFYTGKDKVTFDYVLAAKLRDAGLAIERNYLVDMGNGKRGFVDIMVVAPSGERCAIEVDRASPRARSILNCADSSYTAFTVSCFCAVHVIGSIR